MNTNLILIILATVWIASCTPDDSPADSWQRVETTGEGTILLYYVASDGFAYYDNGNNLTGVTADIFYDFVNWIENTYGYEITLQKENIESWSHFYNTVKESPSGIFGMGNVTITDERWKEIDFSPPYMTNIAVLITNKETEELSSPETIAGEFAHLRALAFEGTLHEERINYFRDEFYPELQIDFAHSNNEIIEQVASDNKYFAYVDVYNYWRAREAGVPLRRHGIADEPSEQFGYILPNNSDWTPIITRFFEEGDGYVNTAPYREIMVTHLGTELAQLLEEARLNSE